VRGIFRCKIKELVRSPVEDDSSRGQHNHPVIPISEVINLMGRDDGNPIIGNTLEDISKTHSLGRVKPGGRLVE